MPFHRKSFREQANLGRISIVAAWQSWRGVAIAFAVVAIHVLPVQAAPVPPKAVISAMAFLQGKTGAPRWAPVQLPASEDEIPTEARAALIYFRLWTRLPIRWKGLGRRPVSAEWLSIGLRGSAIGESNRRASHPTNAILNYGYAVLQSQVAIACASLGLDAGAGVLHTRRPRRPALALDLMEP